MRALFLFLAILVASAVTHGQPSPCRPSPCPCDTLKHKAWAWPVIGYGKLEEVKCSLGAFFYLNDGHVRRLLNERGPFPRTVKVKYVNKYRFQVRLPGPIYMEYDFGEKQWVVLPGAYQTGQSAGSRSR